MRKKYLIMATIALAVLILASSAPAMQSAFISEYQPICPKESYNKITELHEEGWGEEEIAEELAFPVDIVTKYLKGEYIPPVYPEPSQEPSEKVAPKKPVTEEPAEQQQGNLPTEDSTVKFVTVEIPGYGRVTVPEDMVVRDGDEIKIVAKSVPPITPIIEKLPETVWVTVETPYGPVSTSKETIERLGKERFITEQTEFLEQLAELKKMERMVAPDQNSNELADHEMTRSGGNAIVPPPTIPPSTTLVTERAYFYRRNSADQPYLLYGAVDPKSPYNTGQTGFTSYQEREIGLSANGDFVEFISHHLDTGQRNVWTAVWDDWSWQTSVTLSFENVNVPIEFYLVIDNANKRYQMWLKHTGTGEWRYAEYYDTDDFSTYVGYYTGSTELYYPTLSYAFELRTDIRDYWTKIGSTWYRPNQIFYFNTYTDEYPYVEVKASWDANGLTYTQHEAEYPNPGDLVTSRSGTLSGTGNSYLSIRLPQSYSCDGRQ